MSMTPRSQTLTPLEVAARLYGVHADDLTELGAFESDVYAFAGREGPSILKVMAPGHRSVSQVQAEVDWLLALADAGVSVAPPIRNGLGSWVAELEPGGEVVVAYRRAEGRTIKPAEWTEELIEGWGELLGALHAHARAWSPPGPRRRRLIEISHSTKLDSLATEDPEFHAAATALLERVAALLDGSGDAGLVHADLHHGNLLLHDGRWTAIDFDDCGYGSYSFDLAMPIYYAVRGDKERTPSEAAERFVPLFVRGLRRQAPAPSATPEDIAAVLRFRQVEEVIALSYQFRDDKVTPELKVVAATLRERVVAGSEVVPVELLARLLR